MGSVVPLHAVPVRTEADQLASTAPLSIAFRAGALGAQARLLTLLGSDAPLPVLLDALARYVETWAPSMLCSILIRDARRDVLVRGAAPSLPREYVDAIGEVPIGESRGSCGTAAARGTAVTVFDIASSPLWESHRHVALPFGLRACWSVPFLDADGEVLGTLALYYHSPRAPTEAERELITFAAALAKMVLLQHRRLAALWASNERVTLERSVIETAELEREQLALDLHDGVCQQLVGIEWLLAAEAARAPADGAGSLRDLRDLVAAVQRDVRSLAAWLLPLSRAPAGLEAALHELVREAARHHGVPCTSTASLAAGEPALGDGTRDTLLRIVQGAITHALARPDCTSLAVTLGCDGLDLCIALDATGDAFADGEPAALRAARYRALQVGAALAFGGTGAGRSALRLTMPTSTSPRPPAAG